MNYLHLYCIDACEGGGLFEGTEGELGSGVPFAVTHGPAGLDEFGLEVGEGAHFDEIAVEETEEGTSQQLSGPT